MKHLAILIVTYIALAAQVACGRALAIGDCSPPLIWLPVVLALSWFHDVRGLVWAAAIGLLSDGLSDGRMGLGMLAATLTVVLMSPLRPDEDVRSRGPWLVWRFAILGSGILLSRGLNAVTADGPAVTMWSLLTVAGEAAYGFGLCSVFGLRSVEAFLNPQPQRESWSYSARV